MELITLNKSAFKELMEKLDDLHLELQRLQDPKQKIKDQWIDSVEVMELLHISRRTLSNYVSEGRLRCARVSNKNYFKLSDIQAFLESCFDQ